MVLDGKSPSWTHATQNAALLLLSIAFLPLNTTILLLSYVINTFYGKRTLAGVHRASDPKIILVTGVGMTKGLTLARQFYIAGHRVIGADFESDGTLSPGRFSFALDRFYRLRKPIPDVGGSAPYIQGLLDVILKEKVDLWVSCSGVASAVEDGEAKEVIEHRTKCRAIQFDVTTTQMLHEKHTFIERTREIGLVVPETRTITSKGEVEDALRNAPESRKYIMKTIGVDDANRGNMTLLPKETTEDTSKHLSALRISEKVPWILQQFINGEEFCTHSLVVSGRVKAFVACSSSDLLMHYVALPPESALSQAMLRFTKLFAEMGGETFTGHLSFDFLVEDTTPTSPDDIVLYPIECNPRAHTAVCLFHDDTPGHVDGYLDLLNDTSITTGTSVLFPTQTWKFYWIGHDIVVFVIIPLLDLLQLNTSLPEFLEGLKSFILHLLFWKDGTYEVWDPMPWWALYHIYWPMQFFNHLRTSKKWSRLNVSTLKMFEC